MTPYIFQRGETISLTLDAAVGDPLTVSQISASMKMVAPGRTGVSASTPVAAVFAISARAAAGDIPAGWTLNIDAATCAALATGNYLADARLEVAGGVVITDSIAIRIIESVSA
ncbi:MAG: hypothetical protein ABI668_11320 [Sphingorhabdus sp.]